jgi:hypothetical protein
MIAYRAVLSAAFIVLGAVVIVRMIGFGLRLEIVPGLVLGAAMIALGAHRLALIARSRRAA